MPAHHLTPDTVWPPATSRPPIGGHISSNQTDSFFNHFKEHEILVFPEIGDMGSSVLPFVDTTEVKNVVLVVSWFYELVLHMYIAILNEV